MSAWSLFYQTKLERLLFRLGFRQKDFWRWCQGAEFRAIVGRPKWYDKLIVRLFRHEAKVLGFRDGKLTVPEQAESRPGKQYESAPKGDPYAANLEQNAEGLVREGYGEYITAMMNR